MHTSMVDKSFCRRLQSLLIVALAAMAHVHAVAVKHLVSDYIVVGGGLSGLVVASRLSEDPSVTVTVVEAGDDPTNSTDVTTPAFETKLYGGAYDWNITTVAQKHVKQRTFGYQQGFGLGGGSSVNYMAYSRGAPSVFDQWAAYVKDPSWAWSNLVRYFDRSVHFNELETDVTISQYDSQTYANTTGPVQVSYPHTQENFASYFIAAFQNSTDGGPGLPLIDFNAGTSIGVAYHTMTIDPRNSTRSSAASAHLPFLQARGNVKILKRTRADKVKVHSSKMVAEGVYVTDLVSNDKVLLKARREVILSAGAIQTPKLLMLSGIGPKQHLTSHGIKTLLDSPSVGSHAMDHIFPALTYLVKDNITTTAQWLNETYFDELQSDYKHNTGELTSDLGGAQAAERVPDHLLDKWNATYHKNLPKDQNHLQYLFDSTLFTDPKNEKNIVTVVPVLTTPESRGSVRLNSSSPSDLPLVNPNYLSSPADFHILRYGFKRLRSAMLSSSLSTIRLGENSPGPSINTDDEIDSAIYETLATIHHLCGTARMARSAEEGVVDSRLNVFGIRGLRVVDASVFPHIPTTQIQSAVYAMAERAAQIIKVDARRRGE